MKNMKNKNIIYVLFTMLAFIFTFNTSAVFAQSQTDNEEEEYSDEGEEYLDEEDAVDEGEDMGDEEFADEEGGAELYENEEGIDDPDGMYKLDNITAETFQKISNIERENALMKLKIEQEKLKLDLQKQEAEKKKLAASIEDDARNRKIKQEEQDRKIEQERRKAEEEKAKSDAERKKKEQEEAVSQQLIDKINSADLSNPDDIKALTSLMSLVTGKKPSDLGAGRIEKEEVSFDDKYRVKSIIGAAGNLVANIENTEKKSTFKVRNGSYIEDWAVQDIKGTSVLLKKGSEVKVMNLN